MLKKDNIAFGILIGMVLPAAFYGFLYSVSLFVETGTAWARPFEPDRLMLLAIFINLLPLRLYFVSWKMDRTGRGILIITFILVMAFFIFKKFI